MSASSEVANADAARAAAAFRLPGEVATAERFGSGHIHDTFVVSCVGDPRRILLQRINASVFPDPQRVVDNVARVSAHLRARLAADTRTDPDRRCLHCIPTRADALAHVDASGGVWRSFEFIEGAHTESTVTSAAKAREAARAFGAFVAALADFAEPLPEPIPGFHDFDARSAAFDRSVAADTAGRGAAVRDEIRAMRDAREGVRAALPPAALGALPRRLVHNDCKLDNVMFDDASGEALCVVDLDLVMPGSVLFDFGDLVRTAASPAAEDERDLSRVRPDPALFDALAGGYLEGAGAILDAEEVAGLALAGPLITLETAMRFLADHLDGDVYFRIGRAGHNLDRARAQLRLAEMLLADVPRAREAVAAAARGSRLAPPG